jgi:ADP-ribosylglycohydrolase
VLDNYIEDVYAGVLGKVIGVYMGRPFEGAPKAKLEERWGRVDRYVHEDCNAPLVVPDDDITGTLTFIRALEDSGLYERTPAKFFGDTWLNYIIENRSILWWGGVGLSTEHTAFCNLLTGIAAPQSGSIETNSQVVAEQIGAQIFIDCFGMVCPGKPELAAELAEKAASVSHDGEAIYAAQVVAAMVAAAFVEKDMDKLLDVALSVIPFDCLIAEIHKDVRAWQKLDQDWRKTYDRIDEKYGYSKYGGNCHVVPNHAIMVMAWVYAPDNFHESQVIINTAGWDTDCNAANVGSVMGIKVGLARINEDYEFQKPFADRVILPTAEGSRGVSDVLKEALIVAQIGCKIMGYEDVPSYKSGANFHFNMPGALHGFLTEEDSFEAKGKAVVSNVKLGDDNRAMQISVNNLSVGTLARVSTPVMSVSTQGSGYDVMGSAKLYPGMKVVVKGCFKNCSGALDMRMFFRPENLEDKSQLSFSEYIKADENGEFCFECDVPEDFTKPIKDLGIEIKGLKNASGDVIIDSVHFVGQPEFSVTAGEIAGNCKFQGWILDKDSFRHTLSEDAEPTIYFGKNKSTGVFITGTTNWDDYSIEADMKVHMATRGGLIARYQGLKRYVALVRNKNKIQLIKEYYGTTVLAEKEVNWQLDDVKTLKLECCGENIKAIFDGNVLFEEKVPQLTCGGAGLLFDRGIVGFRKLSFKG